MAKQNKVLNEVQKKDDDSNRANVVFSSTNYNMFKFLDANRKLNVRNYSKSLLWWLPFFTS